MRELARVVVAMSVLGMVVVAGAGVVGFFGGLAYALFGWAWGVWV